MKIIYKLLNCAFLVALIVSFAVPTIMFGQGDEGVTELGLVNGIIQSIAGVVIYYVTKVIQTIGVFDIQYFWKDNKVNLLVTIGAVVAISIMNVYSPSLLNSILNTVGVSVDLSAYGTVTFGTLMSGILYELLKKLKGEGRVATDGEGTPLTSSKSVKLRSAL